MTTDITLFYFTSKPLCMENLVCKMQFNMQYVVADLAQIELTNVYFFLELDPPGAVAPRRLNFRGSLRLISARFLVPFPPSQNPLPAFPMSVALQIPQFSGL